MTEPQESTQESDVVERARQAVDAWDRFAVWAPTRVPGVRVCLDLVRDLAAEVESLRDDLRVEGLIHHQCESVDDEVERLRTDLARMTERAEGAEVAWQDAETERDAARAALDRVPADAAREAVIEKAAALIDQPDTWGAPTLSAGAGWAARALFDAGLLADPDVEADQ